MNSQADEIAIIGMACTYPKAPDIHTFWRNIVNRVDAVTDAPKERWDVDRFYDPEKTDGSKLYSKRGGYIDSPYPFNPAKFGVMPVAVEGGEPDQFVVLKVATDAMSDAGYLKDLGEEANVEFILGRGAYIGAGCMSLIQRTLIIDQTLQVIEKVAPHLSPEDLQTLKKEFGASLPSFGHETAPSIMPNLSASRVANRLGFMGATYTIDAACASSLLAVDIAARDLKTGKCDLALAGGVHIFNTVPFLSVFCTLGALSRQDVIRPFDRRADGLVPGEGVGLVVLKRVSEAERDGDRIYAILKGVGSSSDGRGVSLASPRAEGEILAIRKAHKMTGVSPSTIGLIEAHGTATPVGDAVEMEALTTVFGKRDEGEARSCALGSVKSMIGHAMPAAGIAGFIKATLALHYKVLPPTLHCDEPNPKFQMEKSSFYINRETRPWIHGGQGAPRRAGVNAFGFGGINAHAVLEEYESDVGAEKDQGLQWSCGVFLFSGSSKEDLLTRSKETLRRLEDSPDQDLSGLSYALSRDLEGSSHRLSIVASSAAELRDRLEQAIGKLSKESCKKIKDIRGIYYFSSPVGGEGKIAFMFPGEGSAYSNMMLDLCLHFPEVRACFDEMDLIVSARKKPLRFLPSRFIFPAPCLEKEEYEDLEKEFWGVDSGLQSILAANFAAQVLLDKISIRPDMIVGHSAGEYSAWLASGIIDKDELFDHQENLSGIYKTEEIKEETALAAVSTNRKKLEGILEGLGDGIYVSNDNCPHQVVVVGTVERVAELTEILKAKGIMSEVLPSKMAHHTPFSAPHAEPLRRGFSSLKISPPMIKIYSPTIADPYPDESGKILSLMVDYWLKPLEFRKTIESMYTDGARIFIEAGAGTNLVSFVDDTLRGKPHVAVSMNNRRKSGIEQLCHLVGLLAAHHVPMCLDHLFQTRTLPETTTADGTREPSAKGSLELGMPELKLPDSFMPTMAKTIESTEKNQREKEHIEERGAAPGIINGDFDDPKTVDSKGVPGGKPVASTVMTNYLKNMKSFLEIQQDVMSGYLSRKNAARGKQKKTETSKKQLPFIGEIVTFEPGKRYRVRRKIDLREDIFLYDHPFGGEISALNPDLHPLIVVPLTIGIEIMVEAASLFFPGQVPVSVKEVRANRWIEVEEDAATTLTIDANMETEGSGEVHVRIDVDDGEEDLEKPRAGIPAFEATVTFSSAYPKQASLEDCYEGEPGSSSIQDAQEIYQKKYMAHGRRFQVIASLEEVTEKGSLSHLQVPGEQDWFASNRDPHLFVSPLVLDACAQSVGYWAQKNLKEGFITFPIGPENIQFYSDPPRPGDRLECRMRIQETNSSIIQAELDLIGGDGRPWVKIQGWRHRRFVIPIDLYDFWKFPRKQLLSKKVNAGGTDFPACNNMICLRVGHYPEINNTIWEKSTAYLYLNNDEKRIYREKMAPGKKRSQWLAGRIAAKDAVRAMLKKNCGVEYFPADIEIEDGRSGKGTPASNGTGNDGKTPLFSIAHAGEFTVAAAVWSDPASRLEIEARPLDENGTGRSRETLETEEARMLETLQHDARTEWMARFSCAKEAASKAVGHDSTDDPKRFVVSHYDEKSGDIRLGEAGDPVEEKSLIVYTHREGEYILAICHKEGS
ncbi:beta-ketoacyl synthase N-terminal-like domain-containing protein [Thermodesulfobacteriota bacterium]